MGMKLTSSAPLYVSVITLACVVGGLLGVGYVNLHAHKLSHGAHYASNTPGANSTSALLPRPQARPKKSVLPAFAFPSGGRTLVGTYRFVALYGSPDAAVLGALGEQPLSAAIDRVKALAAEYQPLSPEPIYPTFEIITTVASATPTENGDYSREVDPALIASWADAARAAGVYVVLDLQPGRTDFLTQAKEYEALLRQPNVGLALDPEWRLAPTQVPLAQIGSMDSAEANNVATWLASLTQDNRLPQKLFVLHQFRLDMIGNRQNLDTTHPELATLIQMDGQGSQPQKVDTYAAITANPPAGVEFGWKNFYQKDTPMLDPAATMRRSPVPWYISYQ